MHLTTGIIAVAFAGSAFAGVNGFVETFDNDSQNWINFNSTSGLNWVGSGGPDGSAYASADFNLTETGGPFPATVIRANLQDNASGGNLFGNWIAAGITEVSFDIRHNLTGRDLEFTSRFATTGFAPNTPGASVDNDNSVAADTWPTITWDVSEIASDIVSLGGGTYAQIFSSVEFIQIGFVTPVDLVGQDVDVAFDVDNFRLVPAPGAAGLAFVAGAAAIRRRR